MAIAFLGSSKHLEDLKNLGFIFPLSLQRVDKSVDRRWGLVLMDGDMEGGESISVE